jgi:hypothetical protein
MDEELVKRVARAAGRAFSEVTDGAILSTVETEAMALAIIPLVGEFCAELADNPPHLRPFVQETPRQWTKRSIASAIRATTT